MVSSLTHHLPSSSAQSLLHSGAQVNPATTQVGDTPLARAARGSSLNTARLLSVSGLVEAVKNRNIHTVRRLVQAGVDINQPDERGRTPLYEALATEQFELAELLLRSVANPARRSRLDRNLVINLLLDNKLNGAAFLVERYQDVLPPADVHAFYTALFPPQEAVSDNYRLPRYLREIPSPLTPPEGTRDEINCRAIYTDLVRLASRNGTIHDILSTLRRDPRFERAWQGAGCPTIEEVGDEAIEPLTGMTLFSSGEGAYCEPSSNTIRIRNSNDSFDKISALIFETMNLLQKHNMLLLGSRNESGEVGREEYTLLCERIEYNSHVWSTKLFHSIASLTYVGASFSEFWRGSQTIREGASVSHADYCRHQWNLAYGQRFLAANPNFVRRRAAEVAAQGPTSTSSSKRPDIPAVRTPHG